MGCSNAGGKEEEEEGVVRWSFTHIMGVAWVCHGSRTLCTMQRVEQQHAVRERDASARRVARVAQSVE